MSKFDIPCYNCVCLPVCRNKKLKPMFRQCTLVMNFCTDIVSNTSNRKVAKQMLELSGLFNEVLDRMLIPSLQNSGNNHHYTLGFVDIHPDTFDKKNLQIVKDTHRIFRDTWQVDILSQKKTRKRLLKIIDKDG